MNPAALLAIELSAAFFGITRREALARRKSRTVTQARFAAWTALRNTHGWTSTMIGDEFGFDYTNVLHAFNHANPDAVAAVSEGLRAARETEASRIARTPPARAARELDGQGIDLADAPDIALPSRDLRPRTGVHGDVIPRSSESRGPAVAFVREGQLREDDGPARRRLPGRGDDGGESIADGVGLRKLVGVGREALIEMLRKHAR